MAKYMVYYTAMIRLNIHEIKANFSKYIEMVEAGDTVLVCKRNVPIAEIRPIEKKKARSPILGAAKGKGRVAPDFDDPLAEDELKLWYGIADDDPLAAFAPKLRKRSK